MIEDIFAVLLSIAAVYAVCGLIVTVLFLARWRNAFDPVAASGTWGFRLAIVPGIVALWPVILAKARRVARGQSAAGDAESPISPRAFRRWHGYAFQTLAVIVPPLFAAALILRAPGVPDISGAGQIVKDPAALPQVTALGTVAAGLPIDVQIRRGDGQKHQVELNVSAALSNPAVALYWSPAQGSQTLPRDAIFLGSVWGPRVLRFALPEQAGGQPGALYLLGLAGTQDLLATLSLPAN